MPDKPNVPELLPCPFCAAAPQVMPFGPSRANRTETSKHGFLVTCNCGTKGAKKATHQEAVSHWNTRTAMAPAGCGADLREALQKAHATLSMARKRLENVSAMATERDWEADQKTFLPRIDATLTLVADALAATPAPSVQVGGAGRPPLVDEFLRQCRDELLAKVPHAKTAPMARAVMEYIAVMEAQPKASAPSAGADKIATQIIQLLGGTRDQWRAISISIATALREAELRGARKMQEAAIMIVPGGSICDPQAVADDIRALSPATIVEGV